MLQDASKPLNCLNYPPDTFEVKWVFSGPSDARSDPCQSSRPDSLKNSKLLPITCEWQEFSEGGIPPKHVHAMRRTPFKWERGMNKMKYSNFPKIEVYTRMTKRNRLAVMRHSMEWCQRFLACNQFSRPMGENEGDLSKGSDLLCNPSCTTMMQKVGMRKKRTWCFAQVRNKLQH